MDFANNRIPVEALIFRCPFGDALDTCAVGNLRQMPVLDALVLVDEMTPEQIEEVLAHHEECFTKRATLEAGVLVTTSA